MKTKRLYLLSLECCFNEQLRMCCLIPNGYAGVADITHGFDHE